MDQAAPAHQIVFRNLGERRQNPSLDRGLSLCAIIKKRLDIKASLYSILQIFSVTAFETMPIDQLLTGCDQAMGNDDFINQLNLFD